MANFKEIRTRIASVSSTKQITSAMKMVAASKLRKAQNSILQIRPYVNKLQEILTHISSGMDSAEDNIYAQQREIKSVLIITLTSNRGLCGAYNSNVIKKAINIAETNYKNQLKNKEVHFMCIGKKASETLKNRGYDVVSNHHELYDNLTFANAVPVADFIMQNYTQKTYDRIDIIYNEFKNAAVQIITHDQFLPIKVEEQDHTFVSDYIFEPTKEYIVEVLIPKSLKIGFFKSLLEANASEQGARMTAMHKATDNATDLIKELKLQYNKARQTSITNEILEIVGGSEALNG